MKKKFITNKRLYFPLIITALCLFFVVLFEIFGEINMFSETEDFLKKQYGNSEISLIEKVLGNREGCLVMP